MVKKCRYEEIPKLETLTIFAGDVAVEVANQSGSDFNNADWVKKLTCNSKEAPGVEVVLDLSIVRIILSSPEPYRRHYGIDVPEIAPEEVERFQEGLLLERPIGSILSFSSEKKIMGAMLGKLAMVVEGAKRARERNIPVFKDFQFNCNASAPGGTGNEVVLPHCSVIKRHYPKSCVSFLTSFDYIAQAVPSIEAAETILRNIKRLLEDLVDLEGTKNE